MVVSLNYCSQNGGNLNRAPYYNGNPNIGPRIIGNLDQYPYLRKDFLKARLQELCFLQQALVHSSLVLRSFLTTITIITTNAIMTVIAIATMRLLKCQFPFSFPLSLHNPM